MKQKIIWIIAASMLIITGCGGQKGKQGSVVVDEIPQSTVASSTPVVTSTPAASEPVATPQGKLSYRQALTKEELESVKEAAKHYYKTELPFTVLSMEPAEDEIGIYEDYKTYAPGSILVLQVETSHSGEGVYRYITMVKESGEWKAVNEGY